MKILTIKAATELLAKGEVIAIPTETVYGLAADARCDNAVGKIFKAKGRPSDNPLIIHIGDVTQVDELVTTISSEARLLMAHFWPGALTIILPSSGVVSKLATAGLPTIALRMPNHPLALELLQTSGIPLAAPSANLSGKPSPTNYKHVIHDMEGRIFGVINGGDCEVGLESTIIDMTSTVPVILRPGSIKKEDIEEIIGSVEVARDSHEKPKAPGMKYRHYAPNAKLIIVKGSLKFIQSIVQVYAKKKYGLKVGVLCPTTHEELYEKGQVVRGIKTTGENLYAVLREFDQKNVDVILCEYFDDVAVMNRLMKASENRILTEHSVKEQILSEN